MARRPDREARAAIICDASSNYPSFSFFEKIEVVDPREPPKSRWNGEHHVRRIGGAVCHGGPRPTEPLRASRGNDNLSPRQSRKARIIGNLTQ